MAKTPKKPARKGGKKKCAPKKAVKRKPIPQQVTEKAVSDRVLLKKASAVGRSQDFSAASAHPTVEEQWAEFNKSSGDMMTKARASLDSLSTDSPSIEIPSFDTPKHPTVEERFEVLAGPAREYELPATPALGGLLRRALNRVKRAFRFRSAKTGEFVSQAEAEASPDTTVRERV